MFRKVFSLSIFMLLLKPSIAYAAEVSANVNITVPTDVKVIFGSDGTNTVSRFAVSNDYLVPVTIDSISITNRNNWSVVSKGVTIPKDTKVLSLSIDGNNLTSGDNKVSIPITEKTNKVLPISITRGAWTKSLSENAFDLNFNYKIGQKAFTLSFDSSGGSSATNIVSNNGSTIKLPSSTRTGYSLSGWRDSKGTFYNPSSNYVMPIGGDSMRAIWVANTYSIGYNPNTGTGTTATSFHTYDVARVLTKNSFSKTGYSFTGWNTKADGSGTSYTDSQSVKNLSSASDSVITLYAQWKLNSYTLTFNPNGGSVSIPNKTLPYGSKYDALPTPTRNGYTFNGWFTSANGGAKVSETTLMGAGNVTIYSQWTAINYSISYNLDGGTVTGNPTNYNVTTDSILLRTPTKTGYTFVGWTGSNGTSPQNSVSISKGSLGNKSYTANWKANTYTYNIEHVSTSGKTLGNSSISGVYSSTGSFKPQDYKGYSSPSTQTVKFDSVTSKTIKVVYNIITYTITYDLDSGTASGNPSTYTIETPNFYLINPSKTGYTFKGWTGRNLEYPESNYLVRTGTYGDLTFKANWELNNYLIAFRPENGDANITRYYDHGQPYGSLPYPSRNGYKFNGWFTSASGGTKISSSTIATKGYISYYAQWTPVDYTILYYLNGGTATGNPTIYNAETETFTLKRPTRTGHTFKGWTGSTVTGTQLTVDVKKGTVGKLAFVAAWDVNTYKLTYDPNSGSVNPTSKNIVYDNPYGMLPYPSKSGYNFLGWYTAKVGGTKVSDTTKMGGSNTTIYAHWELKPKNFSSSEEPSYEIEDSSLIPSLPEVLKDKVTVPNEDSGIVDDKLNDEKISDEILDMESNISDLDEIDKKSIISDLDEITDKKSIISGVGEIDSKSITPSVEEIDRKSIISELDKIQ